MSQVKISIVNSKVKSLPCIHFQGLIVTNHAKLACFKVVNQKNGHYYPKVICIHTVPPNVGTYLLYNRTVNRVLCTCYISDKISTN